MDVEQVRALGAGALGAALALEVARRWLGAARRRSRAWARARQADRGEERAEVLLRRLGYRIADRQVEHSWSILADGEPHIVELRADLLVTRAGRRLIAEVKTGQVAPRLENASTRRQLLEYALAYPVDGVLLVDMEEGSVREIVFPVRPAPQATRPALVFIAGARVGAALAAWARALL